MASESTPLEISVLTWSDVRDHLGRDPRLIIPVGACDQYGAHLPLGTATLIADALACKLSNEHGVLRAPAIAYGVNLPAESDYAGSATLREKTLHSALNDLLASWGDSGFEEFILLTVHDYVSHVEAIATVTGTQARVRVVEALNLDFSDILGDSNGPEHGGEIVTSLMLYLYPGYVRMDRAADSLPVGHGKSTLRRLPKVPAGTLGSLGRPTLATAEKGRRLYEFICEKIRHRVFREPRHGRRTDG